MRSVLCDCLYLFSLLNDRLHNSRQVSCPPAGAHVGAAAGVVDPVRIRPDDDSDKADKGLDIPIASTRRIPEQIGRASCRERV